MVDRVAHSQHRPRTLGLPEIRRTPSADLRRLLRSSSRSSATPLIVECYHFVQWMRGQRELDRDTSYVNHERARRFLEATKPSPSSKHNSRTSMDDERLSNCTQERWNPEIVADIEGLRLDFLIFQKQVEENTRRLSIINAQKQDENASSAELLDCKKRFETSLSSVPKKRQCNQRVGRKMFDRWEPRFAIRTREWFPCACFNHHYARK